MIRVGIKVFGGRAWMGGFNYLKSLLVAVKRLEKGRVKVILFYTSDLDVKLLEEISVLIDDPPVFMEKENFGKGLTKFYCDQYALNLFRSHEIDVIYNLNDVYGWGFPIPVITWIPDFQHYHLPKMFSVKKRLARTIGYNVLSLMSKAIVVSSNDALKDCLTFLPFSRNKAHVMPFSVDISVPNSMDSLDDFLTSRSLSSDYYYFPGQFWKHKNHITIIEAVGLLKKSGIDVQVYCTGSLEDIRDKDFKKSIFEAIDRLGITENFHILGSVPYGDVLSLLASARAMINPSLFEGWSTTVEEAKALGVPMVLSDLAVHKEQAPSNAVFFARSSAESLAAAIQSVEAQKRKVEVGLRGDDSPQPYEFRKVEFAERFFQILSLVALK